MHNCTHMVCKCDRTSARGNAPGTSILHARLYTVQVTSQVCAHCMYPLYVHLVPLCMYSTVGDIPQPTSTQLLNLDNSEPFTPLKRPTFTSAFRHIHRLMIKSHPRALRNTWRHDRGRDLAVSGHLGTSNSKESPARTQVLGSEDLEGRNGHRNSMEFS